MLENPYLKQQIRDKNDVAGVGRIWHHLSKDIAEIYRVFGNENEESLPKAT